MDRAWAREIGAQDGSVRAVEGKKTPCDKLGDLAYERGVRRAHGWERAAGAGVGTCTERRERDCRAERMVRGCAVSACAGAARDRLRLAERRRSPTV